MDVHIPPAALAVPPNGASARERPLDGTPLTGRVRARPRRRRVHRRGGSRLEGDGAFAGATTVAASLDGLGRREGGRAHWVGSLECWIIYI